MNLFVLLWTVKMWPIYFQIDEELLRVNEEREHQPIFNHFFVLNQTKFVIKTIKKNAD